MEDEALVFEVARINGLTAAESRRFVNLVGPHPRRIDGDKVVIRSRSGEILSRITWPSDPEGRERTPSMTR